MNNEPKSLPSDYTKQDTELKQNKKEYMDYIFTRIQNSLTKDKKISTNKLKLFKFEDTNLLVVVNRTHYKSMIENLKNYYIKIEDYEKCSFLNKIKIVNN